MINMMNYFFIFFFLSMTIMMISIMLSKKKKINLEKMTSFECGFDKISFSRMPFSMNFFLITILFLIFDIELILLIPLIKTINYSMILNWMLSMFFLIMILLLGIFHEWNQGMLNWVK